MMEKYGSNSPVPPRKTMTSKVSLNEVQEGLKAMRQKRLSRLSNFVEEQTKLFEVRSRSKDRVQFNNQDIHISSSENSKNSNFEAISEENVKENIVEKTRSDSNVNVKQTKSVDTVRPLPKRKFLNKWNCVVSQASISSSNEDIAEGPGNTELVKLDKMNVKEILSEDKENREGIQDVSHRKPIYFSEDFSLDSLLKVSENEKQYSSLPVSVGRALKGTEISNTSNADTKFSSFKSPVERNTENQIKSSDRSVLGETQKNIPKSSFEEKVSFVVNNTDGLKQSVYPNLPSTSTKKETSRGPFGLSKELSKKTLSLSKEEKIMKKLQMNYSTVDNLLQNYSDDECYIDSDEMEDFKNTFNDAKNLLHDYETKLNTLQERLPSRQMSTIRKKLADIRENIDHFRGLRKDSSYNDLLKTVYSIENEILSLPRECKGRQEVLEYVKLYLILLQDKVNMNEQMLQDMFAELVDVIGSRVKGIFL